ncbi:MAG: hypothetical protein NWE98_12320 [Candidatus Bathyarchaeota archaeon]|nr:hypothetical protein [Candidatus Bathyarchaeota archaeon]
MSEEGDTFWVSLSEKFFGLILIIIGAIMLYYSATTPDLGTFTVFFGILSVIMLLIGIFLLIVKPPE